MNLISGKRRIAIMPPAVGIGTPFRCRHKCLSVFGTYLLRTLEDDTGPIRCSHSLTKSGPKSDSRPAVSEFIVGMVLAVVDLIFRAGTNCAVCLRGVDTLAAAVAGRMHDEDDYDVSCAVDAGTAGLSSVFPKNNVNPCFILYCVFYCVL